MIEFLVWPYAPAYLFMAYSCLLSRAIPAIYSSLSTSLLTRRVADLAFLAVYTYERNKSFVFTLFYLLFEEFLVSLGFCGVELFNPL